MGIFTFVYQTIMVTKGTFLYPIFAQDCGNLIVMLNCNNETF